MMTERPAPSAARCHHHHAFDGAINGELLLASSGFS
jgi:hypothetical protein